MMNGQYNSVELESMLEVCESKFKSEIKKALQAIKNFNEEKTYNDGEAVFEKGKFIKVIKYTWAYDGADFGG